MSEIIVIGEQTKDEIKQLIRKHRKCKCIEVRTAKYSKTYHLDDLNYMEGVDGEVEFKY